MCLQSISTCVSSTISAQTQKSLLPFSCSSPEPAPVTPFSIHLAPENLQSLKTLLSINKSFPLFQIINLLSDETSYQALHSSLVANDAQRPYHHPLRLASTTICLPASLLLRVSLLNGVWRETVGLGGAGDDEHCHTIGAVQSPY